MRASSLPRRRVIRAHMSRGAKTCRNLFKVKHELEYPDHTVCTTMTEISQNPY
ncbi:hypothetical protein BE221DRAFT_163357, partial [Ostreococcus tauri]